MTRTYEQRVRAYEAEGMTRSDAQGIVDLEDMRASKAPTPERLRCEVCDMPTLGDTLCNLHYEEQENAMTPTPTPGPLDHAALPWDQSDSGKIMDANAYEVVPVPIHWSNAAYIVRACNAHDELLTCLNRIRGEVKLPPDIYKWVDDLLAAYEEGRS